MISTAVKITSAWFEVSIFKTFFVNFWADNDKWSIEMISIAQ